MKSFRGAAVLCLMMIVTIVSVFGSGQTVLKAYAEDAATAESCTYEESIDDFEEELIKEEIPEIKEDLEKLTEEVPVIKEDSEETVNDDTEEPKKEESFEQDEDSFEEQDIMYYGAYFYLLNGIDAEIPEEIMPHPRSDYSEGIYIFDSIKESKEIEGTDLADEPSENENFADNKVTDNLKKMPTLNQIKAVRSDFDPDKHYIQWYVQKYVGFNIHIDGVILTRNDKEDDTFDDSINNSKKIEPKIEKPSEAASSASSEASSEASSFASTGISQDIHPRIIEETPSKPSESTKESSKEISKPSEGTKESSKEISKPSDSAAEASKADSVVDKKEESTGASSSASIEESSANASSVVSIEEASVSANSAASIEYASISASSAVSNDEAFTSASSGVSIQGASTDASSVAISIDSSEEEEPDITIEIEAICNNPVVPDDGQPHLVGDGFKIRIIDNKEPETLIEKIYDAFGEFLHDNVITVSAADGNGTTFKYKNHNFWVNIDAAYAYVTAKDISESGLKIPFWFGGQIIEPGDISVKVLDGIFGASAALPNVSVEVKTSQPSYEAENVITVEAGSTVKNDDGKTLTNDSYEIIEGSLKDGHEISKVVFNGSQTGAGESSNEITSVTIVDSYGKDVSSQYVIKLKKGKLILVENPEKSDPSTWSISAFDAAITESSTVTEEKVGFNSVEWTSDLSDRLVKSEITVITKEMMSSVPGTTVLGARLSATGDDSEYLFFRLIVIVFNMILGISIIINSTGIKNRKRVK